MKTFCNYGVFLTMTLLFLSCNEQTNNVINSTDGLKVLHNGIELPDEWPPRYNVPEKTEDMPEENQAVVITWDPPSSTYTTPSSTIVYHHVAKGETLWSISQRYETSVTILLNLNNLSSNIIQLGQKLRIK